MCDHYVWDNSNMADTVSSYQRLVAIVSAFAYKRFKQKPAYSMQHSARFARSI